MRLKLGMQDKETLFFATVCREFFASMNVGHLKRKGISVQLRGARESVFVCSFITIHSVKGHIAFSGSISMEENV